MNGVQVSWNVSCPRCNNEDPAFSMHHCPVRLAAGDKWPCNCGEDCIAACDGRMYLSIEEQNKIKRENLK